MYEIKHAQTEQEKKNVRAKLKETKEIIKNLDKEKVRAEKELNLHRTKKKVMYLKIHDVNVVILTGGIVDGNIDIKPLILEGQQTRVSDVCYKYEGKPFFKHGTIPYNQCQPKGDDRVKLEYEYMKIVDGDKNKTKQN